MPYSKSAKGRPETGRFMKKIDAALYLSKAAGLYQQLIGSEAPSSRSYGLARRSSRDTST